MEPSSQLKYSSTTPVSESRINPAFAELASLHLETNGKVGFVPEQASEAPAEVIEPEPLPLEPDYNDADLIDLINGRAKSEEVDEGFKDQIWQAAAEKDYGSYVDGVFTPKGEEGEQIQIVIGRAEGKVIPTTEELTTQTPEVAPVEPVLSDEFKAKVDAATQLSELAAMKAERMGEPGRTSDGQVHMPAKDEHSKLELDYIRGRQNQIAAEVEAAAKAEALVEPVAAPVEERVAEPVVAEVTPEPVVTEPVVAESVAAEPVAPEPVATEPVEPVVEVPVAEPLAQPEVVPAAATPEAARRVGPIKPSTRGKSNIPPAMRKAKPVKPTDPKPVGARSVKLSRGAVPKPVSGESKPEPKTVNGLDLDAVSRAAKRGSELATLPVTPRVDTMSNNLLGKLEGLVPGIMAQNPDRIEARLELARTTLAKLEMKDRHRILRRRDTLHSDLDQAQGMYEEAFRDSLIDRLKIGMENGKTEKESRLDAIAMLTTETLAKSRTEYQEAQKLPGARVAKFIQEHKKLRLAIGIGLATVGVAATLGGITPLALGAVGARAVLSGTTAYVGAKRGLSVAAAHGSRTRLGSRAAKSEADIANLKGSEIYGNITKYLGSDEMARGVNGKQETRDDDEVDKLIKAEEARIAERFEKSGLKNNSVAEQTMRILSERLKADQDQIDRDRRGNQYRTAAALAIAFGASALTLALGVDKANAPIGMGGAATPEVPKLGPEVPTNVVDVPSPEVTTPDLAHVVEPGDSLWRISQDTLAAQDRDWGTLSPKERLVRTDRLKDLLLKQQGGRSLIMPGQRVKIPGGMLRDAMGYKQ